MSEKEKETSNNEPSESDEKEASPEEESEESFPASDPPSW